jgi:hypothetical protein
MPLVSGTALAIRGPFWQADATVLAGRLGQGAPEASAHHLRTLFVEANPRAGRALHLPGTFLALVWVERVRISPVPASSVTWAPAASSPPAVNTAAQILAAVNSGRAALLLLQAHPDEVAAGKRQATCIGGEIWLDRPEALSELWEACGLEAVDQCRVHGSGFSAHGTITIPWEDERLAAWLMLTVDLPHTADRNQDQLRLTLEYDRMADSELIGLRQAWQNLSRYVNPRHPRNDLPDFLDFSTPTWVTFEITDPLATPHFYWLLNNWATGPERALHFRTDEVAVLLADQKPYSGADGPEPTALAQVVPQIVEIRRAGDRLEITASAGDSTPAVEALTYIWERDGQVDCLKSEQLLLAYDPVQTADFLRRAQDLPTPLLPRDAEGNVLGRPYHVAQESFGDYGDPLLNPPLLWGFMPLEDGWAQLPFFNLTEQVYVDLGLAKSSPAAAEKPPILLTGALYLGNDDPAVQAGYCNEQPWNMALVNALGISGTWVLQPRDRGYELDKVTLTVSQPDLFLNGLLWLSTAAPALEDALPDLSQWMSAVRPVPLRTIDQVDDLLPPVFRLRLRDFTLALRPTIESLCGDSTGPEVAQASARLGSVTMRFEVDEGLFQKLTADSDEDGNPIPPAIAPDALSRHLPLIWRRHPHLPMVQALPLTQNLHAPNYPNASRQLIPYALQTDDDRPTAEWRFTLSGADAWPRLDGRVVVAQEWGELFDVPLVSLSLPGLELDPNPGSPAFGLLPASDDVLQLVAQLRFDLPYLDQLYALAQLPKPARSPAATSPLPDAAPLEPPVPLRRETFAEYWRTLAEKASLAAADTVDALVRQAGAAEPSVIHLIEPFRWPVQATLDLDNYPGSLSLTNAVGEEAVLELSREMALRGPDGHYAAVAGALRRLPAPGAGYDVTAGTMAAHPEDNGAYRDQGGLLRQASTTAGSSLIKTPVALDKWDETTQTSNAEAFELTSVRRPLTLSVNGTAWTNLWFRDLPVNAATQQFEWASTRSDEAKVKNTDINDPDAQASGNNFLAGYQWHVGGGLELGGLHFHPLVLERVAFANNSVREVVVTGRLQLPLDGYYEFSDLSNTVSLTFERQADETLALTAVQLVGAVADGTQGEWPLALSNGEATEAPLLTWTEITLNPERDALRVSGVVLHFYLFDVAWAITLDPLTFPFGMVTAITSTRSFAENAEAALRPVSLALALDLPRAQGPMDEGEPGSPHQCDLTLRVQLGERRTDAEKEAPSKRRAAFEAEIIFPLVGAHVPHLQEAALFHDLRLLVNVPEDGTQTQLLYTERTLQFNWTDFEPRADLGAGLELFPGMPLATISSAIGQTYAAAPGFAVLRFTPTPNGEIPVFELQMGFVEVLLTSRWGTYLAELEPGTSLPLDPETVEQVFGSSAGDIVFAYTSSFSHSVGEGEKWDETFMLNGMVEIKNLISWPHDLDYDPQRALLELPQARAGSLGHLRHSIRILFNQHEILPRLPIIGADHLIFHLADPWQFLSVVEHQIARLEANNGRIVLASEQRWTAIQEVRFSTAAGFKAWLEQDRVIQTLLHTEPQSLIAKVQTTRDDVNQVVWPNQGGRIEIITHSPHDTGDRPPPGTHWIGNVDPLDNVISYTGFRFVVEGIPQGAIISSARFSVMPSAGFVPGTAIRFTLFVENSLDRDRFTVNNPISNEPGRLWTTDSLQNIVLTAAWQRNQRFELGDLQSLIQDLVNREEWSPDRAVVTVVIQGTADKAFMIQHGYGSDERTDVIRYIAGQKAQLDIQFSLPASAATFGLFTEALRPLIIEEVEKLFEPAMLFVEASAPFWLGRELAEAPALTTLQFLPNGTQFAALSNPEDYAPPNPKDESVWRLLIMPFLGRLQTANQDTAGTSALQMDPLLLIDTRLQDGGSPPLLALALCNHGDGSTVRFDLSGFESLATRALARLDTSTLQENWLRLQLLIPEPQPASLRSVMAARPNTAARLSRDIALRRLYDSLRRHYPPQLPPLAGEDSYVLPPPVDDPLLIWRAASLLLLQGMSQAHTDGGQVHGWHLVGLQLKELTSSLVESPSAHYPATTIIPAWNAPADTLPVSFVVSPYLGLAFRSVTSQADDEIALEVIELLAIDPALNTLRPVSSVLREAPEGTPEARKAFLSTWAVETQQRLTPESPIAVLRIRQVKRASAANALAEAPITTQYAYQLIDVPRTRGLAQRTSRMRSDVKRLRFRQGQLSAHPMPGEVKAFEVAPPQTTGLQAIYQTAAPVRRVDAAEVVPDWPWGVSALRVAVQFTRDQQGISGVVPPGALAPEKLLLWWQSVQCSVHFRTASGDPRPAASLPSYFRAKAIRSLLPVNAEPPFPTLTADNVTKVEAPDARESPPLFERWQSILPGRLRYLVTGARAGVPFVFRHSLLRQELVENGAPLSLHVSGSVAVQHRAPRPVPLPTNRSDGQSFALQPWASYFEPTVNALLTSTPADETFQAECDGASPSRIQIRLLSPANGLLTSQWAGKLRFHVDWTPDLGPDELWRLDLTLVGNGTVTPLQTAHTPNLFATRGEYSAQLEKTEDLLKVAANAQHLRVKVERGVQTGDGKFVNESGFYQVVSLPLFYATDEIMRPPLRPIFVHFEDPEYNRRLGSETANSAMLFDMKESNGEFVTHEVRLSLDRKAYNTTSEIAFRYDWDNPTVLEAPDASFVVLTYISAAGSSVELKKWSHLDGAVPDPLFPRQGKISIESLPAIVADYNRLSSHSQTPLRLNPGERLVLKAVFGSVKEISVSVDIVAEPVLPAPEAAYALLRQRLDGEARIVEAARFAWNPEAARVEMICADDLRTAFVRRRAVFQWQDAARPDPDLRHAVQKIAASGSTHWPLLQRI